MKNGEKNILSKLENFTPAAINWMQIFFSKKEDILKEPDVEKSSQSFLFQS